MLLSPIRTAACFWGLLLMSGAMTRCAPGDQRTTGAEGAFTERGATGSPAAEGGDDNEFIEFILDNGWTSRAWDAEISAVLPRVLSGTAFEGRWALNATPLPDRLNLYVVRSPGAGERVPWQVQAFAGNCSFVGEPSLVACDEWFLDGFLAVSGVEALARPMPDSIARLRRYREAFLTWVLGHEVGHVVMGHTPAHFGANEFSGAVSTGTLEHRPELEADSFFVSRLSTDYDGSLVLITLLVDLINARILAKGIRPPPGVGIHFDYTDAQLVTYARGRSHPEFVVRATRMLMIVGSQGPERLRNVAAMVEPFVRHMREAADPASEPP
jgi:hypothetical protein